MIDDREERREMDEWIDRWEKWVQESYNIWSMYKNLLLFHILAIGNLKVKLWKWLTKYSNTIQISGENVNKRIARFVCWKLQNMVARN